MKKVVIIFLMFFFLPLFAAHADTVGLAVDQSVFSFGIDPGAEKEFSFTVENISNENQQISLKAQDFEVGNNNEIYALTKNNELRGMKGWIKTEDDNIILQAKEKRKIKLIVYVPKDASVGSHFSIMGVNAFPVIDGQNFQQTIVGGQIGIYILVNVKGDVSGNGNIKSFQAPIVTSEQAILRTDFENTGNVHYIPHGEIHLQNLFTRKTQNIETEKHFVFPGKKYSFELQWKPSSNFAIYKAQAFFVDGNGTMHQSQRFMFGKLFFLIPSLLSIVVIFWILRRRKFKKK
jgi:hypothetical protein